jgi:hypothetical protein
MEAHFCKLFRVVMIICNELGNFWAYRLQFPEVSWTDKSFPFEKLEPPRWTVKKWFAQASRGINGQAVIAASPAQWQAIKRPKVLPGTEEESFLRGLDAVEVIRPRRAHSSARASNDNPMLFLWLAWRKDAEDERSTLDDEVNSLMVRGRMKQEPH